MPDVYLTLTINIPEEIINKEISESEQPKDWKKGHRIQIFSSLKNGK